MATLKRKEWKSQAYPEHRQGTRSQRAYESYHGVPSRVRNANARRIKKANRQALFFYYNEVFTRGHKLTDRKPVSYLAKWAQVNWQEDEPTIYC